MVTSLSEMRRTGLEFGRSGSVAYVLKAPRLHERSTGHRVTYLEDGRLVRKRALTRRLLGPV
jgi:hypothetical protein